MLFSARGLACQRGGTLVLRGVDLVVEPGEVVILHGPNGSGKTTLLRTFAGLQPAVAGTITGQEDCAYSSHLDGVKATLTVAENLTFWGDIHGTAPDTDLYREFQLSPFIDRAAGSLSAGQSRRLGLARLVLTRRRVWLMDEPTVSLDTASVARLAATIGRHCAGGGSAVIASHIDLSLGGIAAVRTVDVAAFAPEASSVPGGVADPLSPWLFEDEV